jgi:hypothetical protein
MVSRERLKAEGYTTVEAMIAGGRIIRNKLP